VPAAAGRAHALDPLAQARLHAPSPAFSLVGVEELLPADAALELLELREQAQELQW
jgi:hypothetical protein